MIQNPVFNFVELAKSKNPFKVARMMQEKHFVSISQFNNTVDFRAKDVHGQPVHLHTARIILSREHLRKIMAIHIIY